jgi:hypothetical protein
MAKSKSTRKISTTQVIFYVLCLLVIFSMVFAAVAK